VRIFTADIGGTSSRFGLFEAAAEKSIKKIFSVWTKTSEHKSFKGLIRAFLSGACSKDVEEADAAVIAVAGPVEKGVFCRPPNIPWNIDIEDLQPYACFRRVLLVNDFVAQAYACRTPAVDGATVIIKGEAAPQSVLVVIGAGTGLGQAALIPFREDGWMALASEGGHVPFPFDGDREISYGEFLKAQVGVPYPECDTVVSGGGLSLLHLFLTGERLEPGEISARLSPDSPTIDWMARFYGRVCRNYALQTMALGGVYIAGGVAAKNPSLVTSPSFRKEFHRSVTMGHILVKIPVFLNTNEESGLWGAAYAGLHLLDYGENNSY